MWMFKDEPFTYDTDEGGGASGSSGEGEEEGSDDGEGEGEGVEGEGEGEGEGADKGTGPKPGSKRWNKIYARSKLADVYEGIGSPQEIMRDRARLGVLEKQIAVKEDEGEGDDKEARETKKKRAIIRKQMREVEPNLERLDELYAEVEETRESLRVRAGDATEEVMASSGIEVTDESFDFFANSLDGIIRADKKLYLIYRTNPERAVKMAYEKYAKPFQAEGERKKGSALLKQGAELKRLPKHVKTGSSSAPVKKVKEAQDVKEAEKQFVELFEAAQEE